MMSRLLWPTLVWLAACFSFCGCEIRDVPAGPSSTAATASQSIDADTPDPTRPSVGLDATVPGRHAAGHSAEAGRHEAIQFVDGYLQGYRRAEQENKPMLVFFTAAWCKFCHEMAREALADEDVVVLSRRFVCVRVDADAEQQICQELRVRAYPTVQFVSPRGVPLNRVTGKKTSRELLAQMHAALQAVAKRLDGDEQRR